MVRKECAADGPPSDVSIISGGSVLAPEALQRDCFRKREKEREKGEKRKNPIVVLNLALNCLHLINRARTTTVGSAAAKDRHDHRCTSVMGGHAEAHVPFGYRVVHCHAPDSRTVEMHPLIRSAIPCSI